MPDTGLDEGIEMKAEVFLPEDYTPAENEPFMNKRQLEYFRRKLEHWRAYQTHAAGRTPHRHAVARGTRAPRTPRKGSSRGVRRCLG